MAKYINENTLVPIGLAILVIGASTAWVSNVNNQMNQHQEVIAELRKNSESSSRLIYEVNSRLSRIEWKIEKQGEKNASAGN